MGNSQENNLTSMVTPNFNQSIVKYGYMSIVVILITIPVIFLFMLQGTSISLAELVIVLGFAAIFLFVGSVVGARLLSHSASDGKLVRNFADSLNDSILITDRMGRIHYANQSYAELTNAESVGKVRSIERVISGFPDASEAMFRLAQSVRERRRLSELVRLPQPLCRSDNEARWYRICAWPLDSQTESLLSGGKFVVWQIADVTEHQTENEENFIGFQRVSDLLDEFPIGFLTCTRNGQIQYINRTLVNWLGLEASQNSEQMSLSDLFGGDGKALFGMLEKFDGERLTNDLELNFVSKDGKKLFARVLNQHRISRGSYQQDCFSFVINRTSGEDTDAALRAAEVKFNRLLNKTPIAIATLGRNGEIGRTNSRFLKLFDSLNDAPDGKQNLMALLPAESGDKLKAALNGVLDGEREIPVEIALTEKEEGPSASVFVATAEDGTSDDDDVFIIYIIETTQQRALEAQFAQSQKMQAIGHLAGGIAHDFNNILTTILGATDFLLSNHRETDPSFKDIMSINQNASKAAVLVRQLLAFSRRQTLISSEIQLDGVLSELITDLLGRLLSEKINVTLDNGRNLWPVLVDKTQFQTVIMNLAVNANDAMPEGGEFAIKTANVPSSELQKYGAAAEMPKGDYVLIEIKDNGSGMTQEVIEQIFDPFFTTKDVGKGTGLGLSMVYGVIKQTGGYIYPESAIGEGTKFRIFLPRYKGNKNEDSEKKVSDIQSTVDLTGSASILLVEDEDSVRTFAKRALESRGYTVFEAATGTEALEVFNSTSSEIDLVVSDVVMPEMDGPTLLGELRRISPDIKVIFVSGYAEEAFEKNLPEKEEFSFLPKPFTLKQLTTTVKKVLIN